MSVVMDFLAAGCNNETGVFDEANGFIIYASGRNILTTRIPLENDRHSVICALPAAPGARVHACQWIRHGSFVGALVASDDSFLRIYSCAHENEESVLMHSAWSLTHKLDCQEPVTLASWTPSSIKGDGLEFYSVAATGKGRILFINQDSSIQLVKSYDPKKITALTVGLLPNTMEPFILAALTDSTIRVLTRTHGGSWNESLSISGHQNWITSLSISRDGSDVLSSSLDKSIRVWKVINQANTRSHAATYLLSELVPQRNTFTCNSVSFQLLADSIALGHENAVYFARFLVNTTTGQLEILSGSSDRSLIVWERGFGDAWRSTLQLGDLNGSLGTIGTDHTFSFYGGTLYDNQWVVAAASTGSILFWKKCSNDVDNSSQWIPQPSITGHTDLVESIAWAPCQVSPKSFLISASKDQTTRVFAHFKDSPSFREVARPQIHGYDLKCIAISAQKGRFELISGADEKVLRVFQAPRQFYQKLGMETDDSMPQSAELPALGLSNKVSVATTESSNCAPENEGDLVRNSLWPETDKLYGHNQEISVLAISPSGTFLASAAKSHLAADAALRIWTLPSSSSKWLCSHVVPAHSLTVTHLVFSPDSKILLSVSRDRNLCLTAAESGNILCRHEGHSRIIFSADWFNNDSFLTCSRDKTVKFWKIINDSVTLLQTITFDYGMTALAIKDSFMAIGDEFGNVFIYQFNEQQQQQLWLSHPDLAIVGGGGLGPADSISNLKWNSNNSEIGKLQLAIASADNSIRIISFYL